MEGVDVIENVSGFAAFREEWTQLLQKSPADGLFLTWEWLYTWWKHLSRGGRLFLLTVRVEGELVAVAPLSAGAPKFRRLLPFRLLEFLGTGNVGSDYLNVIVKGGREAEALEALAAGLANQKLVIELSQLKEHSVEARRLGAALERRGWKLSASPGDICPFIDLSGHTWDSYLASLGREHRYNFQRRLKNLRKRFDVQFEQVDTEAARRQSLCELFRLHRLRWQGRAVSNAFHTPGLLSFHDEFSRLALERGWLRLFLLRLGGITAAALYGFRYGRTFYFYQSGFDPAYGCHSVGLISMGLAIQSAIAEGAEEYDLLHGAEEYKFHWARASRRLERLELFPPYARGWLCERTLRVSHLATRTARHLVGGQLADRITSGVWFGVR